MISTFYNGLRERKLIEYWYTKPVIIAVGSGILHFKKLETEGAERFKVANFHYEKIKP